MVAAAPRMTSTPTSVEPVKPIFATSGCSTRRRPTTEPLPTRTFSTPSGMPASSASSARRSGGEGSELGRLDHDRVAARERGAELPRCDVEREVPGDDQPDDAERLAERHVDAACDGNRLAVVLVDGACVEVEDVRDHPDFAARARDRLADVPRLDLRQLLAVLLDERREPPKQPAAVGRRNSAPSRVTPREPEQPPRRSPRRPPASRVAIVSSVAGLTTVSSCLRSNHAARKPVVWRRDVAQTRLVHPRQRPGRHSGRRGLSWR